MGLHNTFLTSVEDKEQLFYTRIPLMKTYNDQLARNEMYLTETFLNSIDGKRDATQVDAQIVSKLAGTITPTKIDVLSDVWAQITIKSSSDSAAVPTEMAFNRENKNTYLRTAMGVSGDTARGAYWYAGGSDRININCETGRVKIAVALDTPVMFSNIIKGLSTTTLRIEDNVVITGNLSCEGVISGSLGAAYINVDELRALNADQITLRENVEIVGSLAVTGSTVSTGDIIITGDIVANNAKTFWLGGIVSSLGVSIATRGRYAFTAAKVGTGRSTISPPTDRPFPNTDYIVQLTFQVDLLTGYARVATGTTDTGFTLTTYVG